MVRASPTLVLLIKIREMINIRTNPEEEDNIEINTRKKTIIAKKKRVMVKKNTTNLLKNNNSKRLVTETRIMIKNNTLLQRTIIDKNQKVSSKNRNPNNMVLVEAEVVIGTITTRITNHTLIANIKVVEKVAMEEAVQEAEVEDTRIGQKTLFQIKIMTILHNVSLSYLTHV